MCVLSSPDSWPPRRTAPAAGLGVSPAARACRGPLPPGHRGGVRHAATVSRDRGRRRREKRPVGRVAERSMLPGRRAWPAPRVRCASAPLVAPVPSAPGAHAGAMIGRLFVMARPSFGRSGSSLSGGGARPLTQVNAVGAESSRAGAHGSLRASLVADGRWPMADCRLPIADGRSLVARRELHVACGVMLDTCRAMQRRRARSLRARRASTRARSDGA